jgi:hypothetical protein
VVPVPICPWGHEEENSGYDGRSSLEMTVVQGSVSYFAKERKRFGCFRHFLPGFGAAVPKKNVKGLTMFR